MSSKDCKHHGGGKRRKLCRTIFSGILIFLFIVLVTVLLIWAILRPSKPTFLLQDVTVYAFNASTPMLTSNFQVTIYSRNPNDNIGVYYDQLYVYASYRNQQITVRTTIPPTYQGHKQVNVWSPFVSGTNVPVAPYNSVTLSQDQNTGAVLLNIKLEGKVRFKVGAFISGHYHLYVQCQAYIPFGSPGNGVAVGETAVKYQLVQQCSVSV